MAYTTYGIVGQIQNTEGLIVQKQRKHPHLCQHTWTCKDYRECPKWHQPALKLTSSAVVILAATVVGLTIWISHQSRHPPSGPHGEQVVGFENGSSHCNCTHMLPRKPQDDIKSTVKPEENLCPNDWLQQKGKCHKIYRLFELWISRQKSCSIKKSDLDDLRLN